MRKYRLYKRGFTLVELVIVIAIIAILAAVVVPTTLHFVEEAHESNDKVLIDISSNIANYLNLSTITNQSYNMVEETNLNKFVDALEKDKGTIESRKYINSISLIFETEDNFIYNINILIKGKKESKNIQVVERILGNSLSKGDIFYGLNNNEIPATIKFDLKNGSVEKMELIFN